MIRAAALAVVVAVWPALTLAQASCPHPPEIGQVVIPPAPCTEIRVAYEGVTRAYPHGVLGDKEEFPTLFVEHEGDEIRLRLPSIRVFEDLHPRIANVDDDPRPEVIVIESDHSAGSRLVVYKLLTDGAQPRLKRLAETGPLGQAYRWLAPVGVADFDGDGQNDIAYVETPHLGQILRIVTLRDGRLVQIASAAGFSNHRIGDAFILGGVRDCGNGPEAITANGEWSEVVATRLEGDELKSRPLASFDGPETFSAALDCSL